MRAMVSMIQGRRPNSAACLNNDQMIDAICRAMDRIVDLGQHEMRARSRYELEESQRLQRELQKAVELRGSLLARYTAREAV